MNVFQKIIENDIETVNNLINDNLVLLKSKNSDTDGLVTFAIKNKNYDMAKKILKIINKNIEYADDNDLYFGLIYSIKFNNYELVKAILDTDLVKVDIDLLNLAIRSKEENPKFNMKIIKLLKIYSSKYYSRENEELKLLNKNNLILSNEEIEECNNFYNTIFFENAGIVNIKYVSDNIENNFYNQGIMQGFTCLLRSIMKYNKYWGKEIPILGESIHNYFTNISKLSAGVQGTTFKVKLTTSIENLLVIKVANNKQYQLLHEYFIGVLLNKLRKVVPNFMYVYGMFRCDKLDSIDQVNSQLCLTRNFKGKDNYTYYMLSEYINGGTLESYIKNLYTIHEDADNATVDLIILLLQILIALSFSNKYMKYTHYDLHTGNVLIRKLNNSNKNNIRYVYYPKNIIPLFTEDMCISTNNIIPVIIDYGYSTIVDDKNKVQDSFLENELIGAGVQSGHCIQYDVFKLIGFMLYNMTEMVDSVTDPKLKLFYDTLRNSFIQVITSAVYTQLSKEESKKMYEDMKYGRSKYFALPFEDSFRNVNINDIISKILDYKYLKSLILTPFNDIKRDESKLVKVFNRPTEESVEKDFENFINNSIIPVQQDLLLNTLTNAIKENNIEQIEKLSEENNFYYLRNEKDPVTGKTPLELSDLFGYEKIGNIIQNNIDESSL